MSSIKCSRADEFTKIRTCFNKAKKVNILCVQVVAMGTKKN